MKKTTIYAHLAVWTSVLALAPASLSAAEPAVATDTPVVEQPAPSAAPAPVITVAPAAVKLPYGADDILKLSRAQVSDDIILNYVNNSGTIYNLAPKDIVYLRDQGVSEKVIGAMLDQRRRMDVATQQTGPAPNTAAVPASPTTAAVSSAAPVYSDPNATYVQAPLTPPASSVYAIPYSPYSYYGPYGYYYPGYYGGWYGPSVSLGFRFGGRGYYGGHGFYGGHAGGHGFGGHRR